MDIAVDDIDEAYNGLKVIDGLIFTGPTGTRVNDLSCVLIKKTNIGEI